MPVEFALKTGHQTNGAPKNFIKLANKLANTITIMKPAACASQQSGWIFFKKAKRGFRRL